MKGLWECISITSNVCERFGHDKDLKLQEYSCVFLDFEHDNDFKNMLRVISINFKGMIWFLFNTC